MENNISRIDKVLNEIKNKELKQETEIVSFGPNIILHLIQNTAGQLNKLDKISNQLIDYFCNPKNLEMLSSKQRQDLLMDVAELQKDNRDFIFKFVEMANKNAFLNRVLENTSGRNEMVLTDDGHEVISKDMSEKRQELESFVRGLLSERTGQK